MYHDYWSIVSSGRRCDRVVPEYTGLEGEYKVCENGVILRICYARQIFQARNGILC